MKTLRPFLVTFVAGFALGATADPVSADDPAVQHQNPQLGMPAARLRGVLLDPAPQPGELSVNEKLKASGALVRIVKAPRGAWQLINPFAPAGQGGLTAPGTRTRPKLFTDAVQHEAGLILVSANLK